MLRVNREVKGKEHGAMTSLDDSLTKGCYAIFVRKNDSG